ncbi:MAG TPA: SAM-dependent chlorinase/fluorinase [Actinomycetota bacterium]|nr:SAM-dependent chlorinase/fluorinase [Actinomycetota bacterium]
MSSGRREVVTFLSDYGLEDEFVGVCHGVMLRIAPWLRIIDVHHNILRQDIRHGLVVLAQSIAYLPEGVHLAVVDPSVGSERRAVVIESGSGRSFVGPDNGLLLDAVDASGGVKRAFQITNEDVLLTPVSHTFQGRDVFAPAAAHLASGIDPSELGPEVPASDLVRLEVSHAWMHDDHLHAEVLQVDRFGNLQFNFVASHLEDIPLGHDDMLEVRMEGHRLNVPLCETFADVEAGAFVLVEDSYRHISLAINKGDAARKLQARAGSTAIVGPTHS